MNPDRSRHPHIPDHDEHDDGSDITDRELDADFDDIRDK